MKNAAALFVAVALSGCAAPETWIFYKPDMTLRAYQRDGYECEKDVRQVNYDRGESAIPFLRRCMAAKGYAWIPFSTLTPETVARIRAQWNDQ
jgi:hypothetical protein